MEALAGAAGEDVGGVVQVDGNGNGMVAGCADGGAALGAEGFAALVLGEGEVVEALVKGGDEEAVGVVGLEREEGVVLVAGQDCG